MNSTNDLNETEDTRNLRMIGQTVTACVFLSATIILAVVGNIGVILVVTLFRQMRTDRSNMLLINLSITDLANTCTVMLSALISLIADDWILGPIWCDIICSANYCLIIVSMLTLCCISIERYQAVIHPLTYYSRVKRITLFLAICYTWVQAIIFAFVPSVLGWVDYDYWEAICAIQWHLYRPGTIIYVVSAFALCFLGPGIILCYCYFKIIKEVQKQTDQITIGTIDIDSQTKRKLSAKTRIIWSLLVIVFTYFICTTPFSLTKLIKVSISDTSKIPGPLNLSAALLGYMASAVNPLIYGIFRKDFQKAYLQILRMIFLGKRRTSLMDNSYNESIKQRSDNNISSKSVIKPEGHDDKIIQTNNDRVERRTSDEVKSSSNIQPINKQEINPPCDDKLNSVSEKGMPQKKLHFTEASDHHDLGSTKILVKSKGPN